MNYAIDIDLIVDEFLDGLGEPLTTILSPLSFGYNDELEPYPYDPEKARQLLAEAGYPNGFTMELSIEDKRRDIAEAYAFMLSASGHHGQRAAVGRPQRPCGRHGPGRAGRDADRLGRQHHGSVGIFLPKLRTTTGATTAATRTPRWTP